MPRLPPRAAPLPKPPLLPLLLLLLLALGGAAAAATISNVEPRRDTDGDIISAGDGCISYEPGAARYYIFGASYQCSPEPNDDCYCGAGGCAPCESTQEFPPLPSATCSGWRHMTYAAWSSADMVTWRKEGMNILPIMTDASSPYSSARNAYFEPCGVYNRQSGFWVLWFAHPFDKGTAVSRSPGGPFELVQWEAAAGSTDFYLWLDIATDALYMKHNGFPGPESVSTMSANYLAIAETSPPFGQAQGFTEGGGIFMRDGKFYVMAGYGCCFCNLGSNGFLWSSDGGALGNYSLLGDFVPRVAGGASVTHAQQFSVTPLYTASGTVPMFIGVRFGSAPDNVKCHDFQYWAPLTFDPATGEMNNVTWVDSFELELGAPPAPPPMPPSPPPPWFLCSPTGSGACVEVPPGAPAAVASLAECQRACVLCELNGTWYDVRGNGIPVFLQQAPVSNVSAAIAIEAPGYWTGANGTLRIGHAEVSGGFCGAGSTCIGEVGPLAPGGPPCAMLSWAAGTWCSPAIDPARCKGARA